MITTLFVNTWLYVQILVDIWNQSLPIYQVFIKEEGFNMECRSEDAIIHVGLY